MNKSVTMLSVLATAGIIALKTMDVSALLPDPRDFWPETNQQNVQNYYAFKAQFSGILNELGAEKITLREANFRVESLARSLWPNYIANLSMSETGKTQQERMARNLVGHIKNFAEFGELPVSRGIAVEAELDEMLADLR